MLIFIIIFWFYWDFSMNFQSCVRGRGGGWPRWPRTVCVCVSAYAPLEPQWEPYIGGASVREKTQKTYDKSNKKYAHMKVVLNIFGRWYFQFFEHNSWPCRLIGTKIGEINPTSLPAVSNPTMTLQQIKTTICSRLFLFCYCLSHH